MTGREGAGPGFARAGSVRFVGAGARAAPPRATARANAGLPPLKLNADLSLSKLAARSSPARPNRLTAPSAFRMHIETAGGLWTGIRR